MKMRWGLLGSSRIVCRHMPPAPGCQFGPEPWPRSPGSSCHVCPPSVGAEQGGVFDARVDGVRIGQRRFEMPDALELPGMRRAVVPLVRAGHAVVDELVADRLPRLAAVVGALDHLPEPAAGLRRIDAIRVDGRSLEVIDLPAAEVRAADVPLLALAIGRQDKRALLGAHQHPDLLIRHPGVCRSAFDAKAHLPGPAIHQTVHCIVDPAGADRHLCDQAWRHSWFDHLFPPVVRDNLNERTIVDDSSWVKYIPYVPGFLKTEHQAGPIPPTPRASRGLLWNQADAIALSPDSRPCRRASSVPAVPEAPLISARTPVVVHDLTRAHEAPGGTLLGGKVNLDKIQSQNHDIENRQYHRKSLPVHAPSQSTKTNHER